MCDFEVVDINIFFNKNIFFFYFTVITNYSFADLRLCTSLKVKVEVGQYQQHNIKHGTVTIQG